MRMIGILLLSSAALFIGLFLAGRLRDKTRQIELSLRCVEDIKGQIRYSRRHSGELLREMTAKYSRLSWLNSDGGGEVYELGRKFCQGLGASDLQGQMDYCDMYIHRFGAMLKEAQRELEEKERLYISLGAFGALAVFILFV